jgi:hypothetical protein
MINIHKILITSRKEYLKKYQLKKNEISLNLFKLSKGNFTIKYPDIKLRNANIKYNPSPFKQSNAYNPINPNKIVPTRPAAKNIPLERLRINAD